MNRAEVWEIAPLDQMEGNLYLCLLKFSLFVQMEIIFISFVMLMASSFLQFGLLAIIVIS